MLDKLKSLLGVALATLTLAACGNNYAPGPSQQVAPVAALNCTQGQPYNTVLADGSTALVCPPVATAVQQTIYVAPVQQRTRYVQVAPVQRTSGTVPTRRVVATLTTPPGGGNVMRAEINVPLTVGRAPAGAVRTTQADWDDPQFNCAKAGGYEGTNPATKRPSCFIYDGVKK